MTRSESISYSHLVGYELQQGGLVVRGVPDVFLGPHQVLHHQAEEEDEPEKMSPDVDSLVVEFEDALDAAIVAQTSPVAGFY